MSDYHLHLHPHGPPPEGWELKPYPVSVIEEYVDAAAVRGVTELAFTEHLYRCIESADVLGPWWERERSDLAAATEARVRMERILSLENYVDLVLRAKDAGLPVLLGLEVDFFPETIDAVLEFLDPYPWDVLIGSIHWLRGWQFDQRGNDEEWDRRGDRAVYEAYFAAEAELAASGAVDVLAHIDRCKMRGRTLSEEPVDLYREVVAAAVSTGVAVEVSSAGLRHPIGEIYPAPTLLRMIHDAGLDITLASDAHAAEGAGHATDELRREARAVGYTEVTRFEHRRRHHVPLKLP